MKTKIQNEAGGVLVLVMVLVVVMGGLGAGLMQLGTGSGIEVSYAVNDANAFWVAEAGIERAKTIGQMKRKRYAVIPKPVGTGTLLGSNVLSGTTSKGSYSVTILDDTSGGWDNSSHTLQKYVISSIGIASGGRTRVVKSNAMLLNYAGYMHASHDEGGVSFGTGSTIDGPVYSDDQLHITGPPGPVFLQLVSSGASTVDYSWTPTTAQKNAIFRGGLALNVAPLDIQGQFGDHVSDIQTESQSGGLDLEGGAAGDYNFTFKSDGKFIYQKRPSGALVTNTLSSLNGTIYVNGNVFVQGIVNGKVTLAARQAINIVSNVVYESASGGNPDPWNTNTFNVTAVNDMLGLMSADSVNVQGTNTINIHASIMITGDGGFNADAKNSNMGGSKYIKIFGGISQKTRGVVANAGSPFKGFRKDYKFDQRFASDAPPSFPPSIYQFSSWQ
jgi:hypothetical protein